MKIGCERLIVIERGDGRGRVDAYDGNSRRSTIEFTRFSRTTNVDTR